LPFFETVSTEPTIVYSHLDKGSADLLQICT
jgi:hypothetical protein